MDELRLCVLRLFLLMKCFRREFAAKGQKSQIRLDIRMAERNEKNTHRYNIHIIRLI